MAKAQKQLPQRITTVDQALEAMGADRVANWLHVHPSELDRMRRTGQVDRGFFAHFHLTLTVLGHTPAPKLYGLKSWRSTTMPGVRRAV